jgi:hypothetical protein
MLQPNFLLSSMLLSIMFFIFHFHMIFFPFLFNHLNHFILQRRLFSQQHLLLSLNLVHVLLKTFNFSVLWVLGSHLTRSISKISASTLKSFLIFVQKQAKVLVISLRLVQVKCRNSKLSWIFNKMLKRLVILTFIKITLGKVWSQILGKPFLMWQGLELGFWSFWICCIMGYFAWSLMLLISCSLLCVIFCVINYCFWFLMTLNF